MSNLKVFAQGLNVLYKNKLLKILKVFFITVFLVFIIFLTISFLSDTPITLDFFNATLIASLNSSVMIFGMMLSAIILFILPSLLIFPYLITRWFNFVCQQITNKDKK